MTVALSRKRKGGPKTPKGKLKVRQNTLTHGVFAKVLLVADEDRHEYETLLNGLRESLRPVGTLEAMLVEKLAVNFWRTKRLMAAEAAETKLNRSYKAIRHEAGRHLPVDLPEEEALPDEGQVQWARDVLAEIEGLTAFDWQILSIQAPLTFEQLETDADGEPMEGYLESVGGLVLYLGDLAVYCRNCLSMADNAALIEEIKALVRTSKLAGEKTTERFLLYGGHLDRQLASTLHELRETQKWRLENSTAVEGEFVVSEPF